MARWWRMTGQQVMDYLTARVFTPLGRKRIGSIGWEDPAGTRQGGTGLCMSRAGFGTAVTRLVMDGGRGICRMVLLRDDEKHIDNRLCANEEERHGYGWQVWMRCAGWAMYGLGGQLAVVCPEKDVCLCTIAGHALTHVACSASTTPFSTKSTYCGMEDMSPVRLSPEIQPLGNNPACALDASLVYHFAAPKPAGAGARNRQGNTPDLGERARAGIRRNSGWGGTACDTGWLGRIMLSSGGWVSADEIGNCCASAAKSSTMPPAAWDMHAAPRALPDGCRCGRKTPTRNECVWRRGVGVCGRIC